MTIGDIWSNANCRLLTATEISQDLSLDRAISIPKFQSVLRSIHDEWIQLLRIGETAESVPSTVLPHPLSIKVDVVSFDIHQLSHKSFLTAAKSFYCTSVQFLRPLHRWNDYFQENIDWDYVWRLTSNRLVDREVADFSWMITRNAVPVHVKVSDDSQERQCKRCLNADETIEHLICECPVPQRCWRALEDLISEASQQRKVVSKFDAVVGPSRVGGSVPTRRMITMLQTMRWIMWKHRCHVVHLAAGDPVLSLTHFFISEIHCIAEINVYLCRDSPFWRLVIDCCPRAAGSCL